MSFVLHSTPTSSSSLNLAERWFVEPTNKKLRRVAHRGARTQPGHPRLDHRLEQRTPYVRTKTADQMLDSISPLLRLN